MIRFIGGSTKVNSMFNCIDWVIMKRWITLPLAPMFTEDEFSEAESTQSGLSLQTMTLSLRSTQLLCFDQRWAWMDLQNESQMR